MKKTSPTTDGAKSPAQKLVPAVLLTIIVVGLALLLWPEDPTPTAEPRPSDTNLATAAPAASSAEAKPDFQPLLGGWLREDGGYVLELKSVESDGRLQATYLNPRPINVSHATATNDAGTLKVRVELNDVGYPGCVYSLVHDRQNDRLIGTYFQAAMGETYEISFVRKQ
jgi:hypothetical protein